MARFCPHCGSPLVRRLVLGRERPSCPDCDYVHFGDFTIGVGGLVVEGERVLLVRRASEPGKGWWQIPGGYVEVDELLDHAVAREVLEETGIRARVVEVIGIWHSLGLHDGAVEGANVYVLCRMQPIEPKVGSPTPDGVEIDAARFFTAEEMAREERVQSLSRWMVERALAGQPGLVTTSLEHPTRPGIVFGLADR